RHEANYISQKPTLRYSFSALAGNGKVCVLPLLLSNHFATIGCGCSWPGGATEADFAHAPLIFLGKWATSGRSCLQPIFFFYRLCMTRSPTPRLKRWRPGCP